MTKNLHTKILLMLLLCFVIVLVAFACAPKSTMIISDLGEGSGGIGESSGGSGPKIDVSGGEKTTFKEVDEFFPYLEEALGGALATSGESDYLAFQFVSEDITVVKSDSTSRFYMNFMCKYNRKDDDKTELLFEINSSSTRALVFGLYY